MSDSTPPRLTANCGSCTEFMSLRPASRPPLSSKEITPPPPLAKRSDETWPQHGERLTKKQHAEFKAWQKAHRWHPHQLRHLAGTEIRRRFGLEAAQVVLGHTSAEITDAVYAERDLVKAMEVMKAVG